MIENISHITFGVKNLEVTIEALNEYGEEIINLWILGSNFPWVH